MNERVRHSFLRTAAALSLLGSVVIASGCQETSPARESVPASSPTPEPTKPLPPTLQAVITMGPIVTREPKITSTPATRASAANEVPATMLAVSRTLQGATATPYQRPSGDRP